MKKFSRRKILTTFGVAASSVLLNNCASKPESSKPLLINSYSSLAPPPEIPSVRLGFIPSVEIAPLLVAQNRQLFAKYGMTDVQLVPFRSWQDICDRTKIGTSLGTSSDGIDGGHLYSPLPELLNEGLITPDRVKTAMYVLMRLHTHGGHIVTSNRLKPFGIRLGRAAFAPLQDVARLFASPIYGAIAEVGSNYDLWLRYWLAAMQIIPNRNIDILAIASDEIATAIKQNRADLLCLARWNTLQLSNAKLVNPAIAIQEIWQNYPGELLAMRADWVDRYPNATQAIIKAIIEAQIWCDRPDNARELNTLLALSLTESASLIDQPAAMFAQMFKNSPAQSLIPIAKQRNQSQPNNFPLKYWSNDGISVSYPYKSHDLWFLTEYQRWGMLADNFESKETIDAVNREDLWKSAAKAIGVPDTNIPIATSRGIESFFDGNIFDPNNPQKYLSSMRT
ncbi:ABC transporter substrate-binding protein [Pseudanabaena biceps]|nr:ABC transporter substrate-binding protein [Pseudanabaena biceps]